MSESEKKVDLMIRTFLAHVGPMPYDMRRAMRAVHEALQADEIDEICLTRNQVRELVEMAREGGPASDSDLTLVNLEEFRDEETDEIYPAGLYVFLTEYPEEGFIDRLNLYDAEEAAALDALIASASAKAQSGEES